MRVTYYDRATDPSPSASDTTWEAWADLIQSQGHVVVPRPLGAGPDWERSAKLDCLGYSPAELAVGTGRASENVLRVHFGVVDFDHISPIELTLIQRNLTDRGLAALLVTTWSHAGPTQPRCRAILPFAQPIQASRGWGALYARLGALVGGGVAFDSQCKDLARLYFWPSCPSDRAHLAWVERYHGRPLTQDDLLAVPMPTPSGGLTLSLGTHKVTRPELEAVRDTWLRSRRPETRVAAHALRAVLAGDPWAYEGERDSTLHRLCVALALEWPALQVEHLARVFEPSCALMGGEFTAEFVASKLHNAVRFAAEKHVERESKALRDHEVRIQAATLGKRTTPYDDGDLADICAQAGAQPPQMPRRWILQEGDSYWFFVLDRGYVGPQARGSATVAAHQYLAAAEPLGVHLEESTDRGMRKRTIQELAGDYGTPLEGLAIDLTGRRPTYDPPTNTLIEAPCPLRDLAPEYHPGVDAWLRALGGTEYGTLSRWIAWATHLDQPCAALFLEGQASAGKTMLALGLSRLWTAAGPTSASEALADFNGSICDCPLIFADEQLPKGWSGRGKTAEIRDLIGATSHQIKRKFRPSTRAKGAVRLIVAANNRNILSGERDLSADDVVAIQRRFLYVRVGAEAADIVARAHTYQERWVDGDVIARHALWLKDEIPLPARPPRFLIEQTGSNVLTQTMAMASHAGGLVANWIVRYLLSPQDLQVANRAALAGIRVEDGALWLNSRAVVEGWRTYLDDRGISVNSAGQALRALTTEARDFPGSGDWRVRLHRVNIDAIVAWAEDRGYASGEQILGSLAALSKTQTPGPRVVIPLYK